jgi:hypothetical protein
MEKLIGFPRSRIQSVNTVYKRHLRNKINWNNRLIAVTGARGVGKTTMLLQYIRENLNEKPDISFKKVLLLSKLIPCQNFINISA